MHCKIMRRMVLFWLVYYFRRCRWSMNWIKYLPHPYPAVTNQRPFLPWLPSSATQYVLHFNDQLLYVLFHQGWIMEAIPQSRELARELLGMGIIPKHVGKNMFSSIVFLQILSDFLISLFHLRKRMRKRQENIRSNTTDCPTRLPQGFLQDT